MDSESKQRLRLDRRLIRRRGHIGADELARELEKLPDASHKAVTLQTEPPAGREGAGGSEPPRG